MVAHAEVVVDRARFWSMIQAAKTISGRKLEQQTDLLEEQLRGLPPSEIVSVQRILEELHAESWRIDLWGAAFTIDPKIRNEDRFFAFRGWLVGQGQHVYTAAVAEPDSLADYADLQTDWPQGSGLPWFWGEGIWCVALEAYEDLTGGDIPGLHGWPGTLVGEWWDHEAELRRRYPRLWARFRRD